MIITITPIPIDLLLSIMAWIDSVYIPEYGDTEWIVNKLSLMKIGGLIKIIVV